MAEQSRLLSATGCTKIFEEQVSSVSQRAQLAAAMAFVRIGDALVVSKLDRLARSTTELLNVVGTLEAKGVALRILDFGGADVDTQSATGRMLLTIMAAVAEAERSMMLERQRVGVAKAKAEGRYKGRAPTARRQSRRIVELHGAGKGASAIAGEVGVSRASVYRILADAHTPQPYVDGTAKLGQLQAFGVDEERGDSAACIQTSLAGQSRFGVVWLGVSKRSLAISHDGGRL